jgi:hypothetical protein
MTRSDCSKAGRTERRRSATQAGHSSSSSSTRLTRFDKLVKDEEVKLRLHVGAARYVSVTSGYRCVDIRKYYLARDGAIKPTKTGIALRLFEWSRLKETVKEIKEKHPKVARAQPYWTRADHFNQEGAMMCVECNPFGTWSTL